jgi:hypothetical protein
MSATPKFPVMSVEAWRDAQAISPTAAKELFAECVRNKSIRNLIHIAQAGYGTGPDGADYLDSMTRACAQYPIAEKVLPTWLSEVRKEMAPDGFRSTLLAQLRRLGEMIVPDSIDTAKVLMRFGADPFYDKVTAHDRGWGFEQSAIEAAVAGGHFKLVQMYLDGRIFDAENPLPTFAVPDGIDSRAMSVPGFRFPRRNLISLVADKMTSLNNVEDVLTAVRERIAPGYMEPYYEALEHNLDKFADGANVFARSRLAIAKIHEIAGGATPRPTSEDGVPRPGDWATILTLPANERGKPLPYACLSTTESSLVPIGLRRLIVEGGLDVNAVHPEYGTLLHEAAFRDNPAAVQVLLEHGADASLRLRCAATPEENDAPMTPAEVADYASAPDVAKMIRAHGAHSAIAGVLGKLKRQEGSAP